MDMQRLANALREKLDSSYCDHNTLAKMSDDELLKVTKGTSLRASVELCIALPDLRAAIEKTWPFNKFFFCPISFLIEAFIPLLYI